MDAFNRTERLVFRVPLILAGLKAILALCALMIVASASEASERRQTPAALSEETKALGTLSAFANALRDGSPVGAALLWLPGEKAKLVSVEAASVTPEDFSALLHDRSGGHEPMIRIVRPRVIVRDGRAIVRCLVIWDIVHADGSHFHWTGRDEFVLAMDEDAFRIADSRVSSLVVKYAYKPAEFYKQLAERERDRTGRVPVESE